MLLTSPPHGGIHRPPVSRQPAIELSGPQRRPFAPWDASMLPDNVDSSAWLQGASTRHLHKKSAEHASQSPAPRRHSQPPPPNSNSGSSSNEAPHTPSSSRSDLSAAISASATLDELQALFVVKSNHMDPSRLSAVLGRIPHLFKAEFWPQRQLPDSYLSFMDALMAKLEDCLDRCE